MINNEEFNSALQSWRLENNHSYPWREKNDIYHLLVAITMLQQTSSSKVAKDFFPKFISRFPDIQTLANTKWTDVFTLWRGLGAYSKGKNLLRTAKEVIQHHNGVIPTNQEELEKLPGIKPPVARALIILSQDKPEPLLNCHSEKLLYSIWPNTDPKEKATELIKLAKSPTTWNNNLQDLCSAIKENKEITGELGALLKAKLTIKEATNTTPSEKKKKKVRKKFRIEVGAACIYKDGKYLVQTRPMGKSFVGQWEFPGGKREKGETIEQCIIREIIEELGVEIKVNNHICDILQEFERTELLLRFYECDLISGDPVGKEGQELRWVEPRKFNGLTFLNTNAECIQKLQEKHL